MFGTWSRKTTGISPSPLPQGLLASCEVRFGTFSHKMAGVSQFPTPSKLRSKPTARQLESHRHPLPQILAAICSRPRQPQHRGNLNLSYSLKALRHNHMTGLGLGATIPRGSGRSPLPQGLVANCEDQPGLTKRNLKLDNHKIKGASRRLRFPQNLAVRFS